MLLRIPMPFLLICSLLIATSHVLGAPTEEPVSRISINDTCPEKCICLANKDNPELLDVVCSPESEINEDTPPKDTSVQDIVELVDTVVVDTTNNTSAEETSEVLNDVANNDASVEQIIVTNMEIKIPENNTMQSNAPQPETTLEPQNDADESKEEGDSDEVEDEEPEVPAEVKVDSVEKHTTAQEQTPAPDNSENDVMLGDQPISDVSVESNDAAEEEEVQSGTDEVKKEESDKKEMKDEEKILITETAPASNVEVPEELVGDSDVRIVAKKGPQFSSDEAEGTSDEEETDSEEKEPAQPSDEEPQVVADAEKVVDEEEIQEPLVTNTEAPPPEVKPEESKPDLPQNNDYDSDENTDSEENNNEILPDQDSKVTNTEAPEDVTSQNLIQRIQAFETEKVLDSDIDNIILPGGEVIVNADISNDAMSGKMISDDTQSSTQPQQSTASWVILGLIFATFVGVIGYATVRGRMDKKAEATIAKVVPPSAPSSNEMKSKRKPDVEGTELKVLSRPLLQPAEEENNTVEFKDKKENGDLHQVVINDVPDNIPYIDDSDGGQKMVKPARKRAPPPPIQIPGTINSDGPMSPSPTTTTPTLVRTRIVDNSPQVARIVRNMSNNPFDE